MDIYEFVRNFYISLITALVALIGVVITRTTDPFFAMGCYKLHVSVPFLISIVVATQLFYSIDRHWYHRLLVGAVKNAIEIEKKLIKDVPGIGLTTMIGDNSPLDVSAWTPGSRFLWITALLLGADKRVWKDGKIHSDAKISMFYKGVASVFAIMVIIVIISGGLAYTCENLPDKGAENTNAGPAQAK